MTNLCPGVTQVNVTDANGCLVTQTVAIPLPPIPTIAISATNTSCQTNCNGSASATVTGGTGGYTYQWIGPSIASGSTSSNPIGMCAGFYTLAVTDAIGCQTATMVNVGVSL
ncbi:MAG: hypothetical protein IPG89_22230 [Bacteroidetes bacterium]|nr:hypothetical protein [Bacteroidota bacterium]